MVPIKSGLEAVDKYNQLEYPSIDMSSIEFGKDTPKGVSGFPGRGTAEDRSRPVTLADLHRGDRLPEVVQTLAQLGAREQAWLSKRNKRGNF